MQESIGALYLLPSEKAKEMEWAFPMFEMPKKNKIEMRTNGDFHKLNALLERNPCHFEPIHELAMLTGRFK